jgi:hypothetical protein
MTPFFPKDVFTIKRQIIEGTSSIRIRSFIFQSESFGEYIAALVPILVYRLVDHRPHMLRYRAVLLFLAVLLISGQLLAVTRSGMVLTLTGLVLTTGICVKRNNLIKIIMATVFFSVITVCLLYLFEDSRQNITTRFSENINFSYHYTPRNSLVRELRPFFHKINRDFWTEVIDKYMLDPTVTGNGFITPYHFHNLWFTLIYQIGLAGFAVYVWFLFGTGAGLWRGYRKERDKLFLVFLISFVILLINEMKYEFTRYEHYYQACMTLVALFVLMTVKINNQTTHEDGLENTMISGLTGESHAKEHI